MVRLNCLLGIYFEQTKPLRWTLWWWLRIHVSIGVSCLHMSEKKETRTKIRRKNKQIKYYRCWWCIACDFNVRLYLCKHTNTSTISIVLWTAAKEHTESQNQNRKTKKSNRPILFRFSAVAFFSFNFSFILYFWLAPTHAHIQAGIFALQNSVALNFFVYFFCFCSFFVWFLF